MSQARLFRYKIQDVGVNIHRLHEGSSGVVNVLIHGFTAITSDSDIEVFRKVATHFPDMTTLLVHWDSGDAKKIAKSQGFSAAATAGTIGLGMFTGGLGAIAARLGAGAATAALGAGLGVASSFGENQEKADRLAFALNEILDLSLKDKVISSLNLIGHSLGGRIIVKGLLWAHEHIHYPIDKVILMGAAVDWPEQPLPILNSKDTVIYNFYSASDGALTVKTDLEKCIGKHGIPEEHEKIQNICCLDYGHTEYWPHVHRLFDYVGIVPAGNTFDDLAILQEIPMKMLHLLLSDDDLYPILCTAEEQELASLVEILGARKASGIDVGERNPLKIGVEIQLLGGDSVANKSRGYGVNYATIIKDVATYLKLPLQLEQAVETEKNVEDTLATNNLKSILRGRLGVTAKQPTTLQDLTTLELEEAITAKVIEQCQARLADVSDEDFERQMLNALKSSGRDVTVKASTVRTAIGAGGVAGVAAACVAIPVVGWAIGAAAVGTAAVAATTTTLSSAAYEALIPCIVLINTIRNKEIV